MQPNQNTVFPSVFSPRFALAFLATIALSLTVACGEEYRERLNVTESGVAIEGYDPVAYFEQNEPRQGNPEITAEHEGATYSFSSEANRDLFQATPDKYLPEYGGWCAYAMANDEKVKMNPETYKIVDGKLYLFFNEWYNNTLPSWNEQEDQLINQAEDNWSDKNQPAPQEETSDA